MKIALIRRNFSAIGGAELYLQRLVAGLAATGHEPHLFAEFWTEDAPATIHPVRVSGSRAQRLIRFARTAEQMLKAEAFDCVFSLERTMRQDVYRAGDGVHRCWLQQRKKYSPWYRRPLADFGAFHRNMLRLEQQTFSAANTRHIIVNSEMVRCEIEELFDFPRERIHLVRNGIDVNRFKVGQREATRQKLGISDDEFLLLFVGSGWERKGLRFVLKALAGLSDRKVRLLVLGKGRKPYLCPPRVIFAESMPQIENAYAAADLFVFPTIYDPSANVTFEALAAGLPVVTTTLNGASEVLRNGVNGSVLGDPGDVPALVAAIRFWMQQPKPARVNTTADLSIERNVRETLAVLELATKGKGR